MARHGDPCMRMHAGGHWHLTRYVLGCVDTDWRLPTYIYIPMATGMAVPASDLTGY